MSLSRFEIFRWLKQQIPLRRQARIASAVLPRGWQYRFALEASRIQGRLMGALGGNRSLTEALMRDHWLRELTLHGPYPIPWRLHGREVLDQYASPGPVLYYNTHLPLVEIPLRVLMELGYPMPVPVVDPGRIVGSNQYVIAGMAQRVPAIPADSYVLAKLRTVLMQGNSAVCLADTELAGELMANPLRLAARMRVPVIFGWGELAHDNVLDVTFSAAPHPLCEDESAIAENLEVLRGIRERLLHRLGVCLPQPMQAREPHTRELLRSTSRVTAEPRKRA